MYYRALTDRPSCLLYLSINPPLSSRPRKAYVIHMGQEIVLWLSIQTLTYIIDDVVIKLLRDEVIQTQNPYAILIPY